MCDYIKFCAYQLLILISFGYQRHYKNGNLFPIWMDGNDQPPRENKFLQKTCWIILKIRSRSRHSWPDFRPWRQLLTPLPHIHTSSPPLYLYVTQYFVPSWNTSCPPPPHTFCFRGFTKTDTHRYDGRSLKTNEFFGGRDSHPSLSKCNKP
jgi:hypothetical protein